MGIFDYFRSNKESSSASVAKERLQIIVAHERGKRASGPSYLPQMQQEIVAVIRKYVDIDEDQVQIQLDNNAECSVLELNVTLPD